MFNIIQTVSSVFFLANMTLTLEDVIMSILSFPLLFYISQNLNSMYLLTEITTNGILKTHPNHT